ncbi:MAG: phospholipase [bacterium]
MLYILIALIVILLGVVAVVVRKANRTAPETPPVVVEDDCCGEHAVCERDTLLSSTDDVIYFDDEELDVLSGKSPDEFTPDEIDLIEDIFYSLKEQDVSGWVRSLQLRNIYLPEYICEQALFIVKERRETTLENWQQSHN